MQAILAIGLLIVLVTGLFFFVRWQVRRRPAMRRRMIAGGGAMIVLGFACGIWLPSVVPDTPGSPATTVAIVLLWIIGAVFVLLGVPALFGAAFARPEAVEPAKDG